jgi:hypothetical protein
MRLLSAPTEPAEVAMSAMPGWSFAPGTALPRWRRFVERIFLGVVNLDREVARLGARVARRMARRGLLLHYADTVVVRCATRIGAVHIVVSDADFNELPEPFRVEYVKPSSSRPTACGRPQCPFQGPTAEVPSLR